LYKSLFSLAVIIKDNADAMINMLGLHAAEGKDNTTYLDTNTVYPRTTAPEVRCINPNHSNQIWDEEIFGRCH